MHLHLLLLASLLTAGAALETEGGGKVKEVHTAIELEAAMKGKSVVMFYADWCHYSQEMLPRFDKAAKKVKNVKFIKVDADKVKEVGMKFKIEGFPIIKAFKDQEELGDRFDYGKAEAFQGEMKRFQGSAEATAYAQKMEQMQKAFDESEFVQKHNQAMEAMKKAFASSKAYTTHKDTMNNAIIGELQTWVEQQSKTGDSGLERDMRLLKGVLNDEEQPTTDEHMCLLKDK